jgi:hypothetical protein
LRYNAVMGQRLGVGVDRMATPPWRVRRVSGSVTAAAFAEAAGRGDHHPPPRDRRHIRTGTASRETCQELLNLE